MTIEQEVDARVVEIFEGATIEDLERGLANAKRMALQLGGVYRPSRGERDQAVALRKHAALLRQELQKRQGEIT